MGKYQKLWIEKELHGSCPVLLDLSGTGLEKRQSRFLRAIKVSSTMHTGCFCKHTVTVSGTASL